MNDKNLPDFQQELKNDEETKDSEKQSGQRQEKRENIPSKPRKGCYFLRNWGGWMIGGE